MSSKIIEGNISDSTSDDKEILKAKKSNKKSKKSKHKHSKSSKKETKHKKKKRRRHSSSSQSSSSEEEEWVTKEEIAQSKDSNPVDLVSPPHDEDEWSGLFGSFPTSSRKAEKAQKLAERKAARVNIDEAGRHALELNPYWKDGGSGLPQEEQTTGQETDSNIVGDGGLSWLRKSYLRAKEQAKEQGKTLEEVAEERWGSLEAFFTLLEEAEMKAKKCGDIRSSDSNQRQDTRGRSQSSFQRSRQDSHEEGHNKRDNSHKSGHGSRSSFQRPRDDSDEETRRRRDDSHRIGHGSHSTLMRSGEDIAEIRHRRDDSRQTERGNRSHNSEFRDRNRTAGWKKERDHADAAAEEAIRADRKNIHSEAKLNRNLIPPRAEVLPKEEHMEDDSEKDDSLHILTEKELNELSAKILKAEMLGNEELAKELKEKKNVAEKMRNHPKAQHALAIKTITKVVLDNTPGGQRRKPKPGDTHQDGKRQRYFADDDKHSLQSMFEKEKRMTVEQGNAVFSSLIGKGIKTNQDYDMDDAFVDRAGSSKTTMKEQEREVREVMENEKKYNKTVENCAWCFDGKTLSKNLVVAMGEKSYLCLPPYQSMTEGHCLIVPMHHIECATYCDEDVWEEMKKFRKAVVDMFLAEDQDVVFFENARNLKSHPHMYVECVPMPKEVGELAPIYFKKAIQECESEWSQNKKLIDLRNRDVRKGVPKGLPYFCVDFGTDSGFAHVIEDEREFPPNFAPEILGGMMELDHSLWRKRKPEDFHTQRTKVMEFLKLWGPYDWTNT